MSTNPEFTISKADAQTILQWHAFSTSESYHRGGDTIMTSDEIMLLNTLNSEHEPIPLSVGQLLMINDWMIKSVKRKYGSSAILLREEQNLYSRIEREITRINS